MTLFFFPQKKNTEINSRNFRAISLPLTNGSLMFFCLRAFMWKKKQFLLVKKNIREIIPLCGSSRLNLKPYVTCLSRKREKTFFPSSLYIKNRQCEQQKKRLEKICDKMKRVNESATYFLYHDTNLWWKTENSVCDIDLRRSYSVDSSSFFFEHFTMNTRFSSDKLN